jgi:hypothetical protein
LVSTDGMQSYDKSRSTASIYSVRQLSLMLKELSNQIKLSVVVVITKIAKFQHLRVGIDLSNSWNMISIKLASESFGKVHKHQYARKIVM